MCQGRFSQSLVRFHVTVAEICWAQDFGIVVHDVDLFEFLEKYLFWPHEGILLSRGDSGRHLGT